MPADVTAARTARRSGGSVLAVPPLRVGPPAVWAVLVVVGLTLLPLPFTGDQALYLQYGERLMDGAVLYRDVWDVKQPGIFWFHGIAAGVLGASEVGVHVAVVAWCLLTALVARRAWGDRLDHPAARTAVPLLVAGTLLATVRPIDIGQVEQLVGLPLLGSWWLLRRPDPSGARGRALLAGSGALAALAGIFKHLYLAMAIAFVALALARLVRRAGRGAAARAAAWWTVGLVAAIVPVAVPVLATGQVGRVWWTFVSASSEMRALDPPPLARLVRSTARAGVMVLPLVVLAVTGRRRAWRPANRAGTVDMLAWLVVGALTLAPQLWWPYQQVLLFVPLGLLATHGVDELAHRWRAPDGRMRTRLVATAVVVAALAAAAPLAVRTDLLVRHDLALTAAGRAELRRAAEPAERAAAATRAFLTGPEARPGDVLLLGNPVHLLRTGREQAGPVHGWSPEYSTPQLWADVVAAAAGPDVAYVAIDADSRRWVDERAPELVALLERAYRPVDVAPGSELAWWEPVAPL